MELDVGVIDLVLPGSQILGDYKYAKISTRPSPVNV